MKLNNLFGAIAIVALFFAYGCKNEVKNQTPPEYAAMTVTENSVTVRNSFPAVIEGYMDTEIRSNVNGFIIERYFNEGDVVKKGDVLFEIDHSIYLADYNTALAKLHVAQANVETAKLTAENKANLHKKGIISEYEKKVADNALAQAVAQLEQSQAQLETARTNLDYSYIKSPLNGVIGSLPFNIGQLVGRDTKEPLTIVSQIDRMYASFSIDEKMMLNYTEKGGVNDILKYLPDVELKLANGKIYEHKGKVESISGVLDVNTGSAKIKALFKNDKHLLRRGNTGSILIPQNIENALLVPQSATFEMQDKKFVYLLNDSNVTVTQEIKVQPLTYEQNYIVTDGLKAGDRIVVEGVGASVKNGMKITPITKEQSAAKLEMATSKTKGEEEK